MLSAMKERNINLEILLVSNCGYLKRDWCEIKPNEKDKKLSEKEQLAKLCWNGMLKEMIPEIIDLGPGIKPLTLWEINDSGNLLDLRYGDFDIELNDEWSINPYVYITFSNPN